MFIAWLAVGSNSPPAAACCCSGRAYLFLGVPPAPVLERLPLRSLDKVGGEVDRQRLPLRREAAELRDSLLILAVEAVQRLEVLEGHFRGLPVLFIAFVVDLSYLLSGVRTSIDLTPAIFAKSKLNFSFVTSDLIGLKTTALLLKWEEVVCSWYLSTAGALMPEDERETTGQCDGRILRELVEALLCILLVFELDKADEPRFLRTIGDVDVSDFPEYLARLADGFFGSIGSSFDLAFDDDDFGVLVVYIGRDNLLAKLVVVEFGHAGFGIFGVFEVHFCSVGEGVLQVRCVLDESDRAELPADCLQILLSARLLHTTSWCPRWRDTRWLLCFRCDSRP